jgi:hypothetical protein
VKFGIEAQPAWVSHGPVTAGGAVWFLPRGRTGSPD